MEPILRFENVSKHYPNGVHALGGVSFEVAQGEFLSVIGPSGSGKSTLLRAINRLIPISGGTVWLDSQAVSALRQYALSYLLAGINILLAGFFTALGHGRASCLLSLGRGFALLPLSILVLSHLTGGQGIWLAALVGEGLSCLVGLVLLKRVTASPAPLPVREAESTT